MPPHSNADIATRGAATRDTAGSGGGEGRRRRCRYGAECWRKSAQHKAEFSHPGDEEWRCAPARAAAAVAAPAAAMATSKRKATAGAPSVDVDGIVWAKLKGYPAWPARVQSLSSSNTRATVEFFGTADTATVALSDITVWTTESHARLSVKSKTKAFHAAVAAAQAELGITRGTKRQKARSPPADAVASPVEATGGDDEHSSDDDEAADEDVPASDPHVAATDGASAPKEEVGTAEGLSEYEQQRLQNIARNEAMLRQLNIQPLETAAAKKPRARAVRGLKSTRRSSEPVIKRERSLRIAGKTPDGVELPPTFKEPTFAEMRFAGDHHHRERIEGELKLADALREDGKGMKRKPKTGEDELMDEETEEIVAQRKADSASRFAAGLSELHPPAADETRATVDEEVTLGMLRGLQVKETDVAKVVPERIFSLAFHPSRSKLLVAAGDKWGSIGFFDPDAEEEAEAVTLFSVHTRPIPCLDFDFNDAAKLYSSSYDNTMRCLDVAAMQFTEVFAGDDDYHLAYSAYSRDHKTAYLAFNTGELGVVDLRAGKDMKQCVPY